MDVTKEDAWTKAVQACIDNWGGLDICVNNAGTSYKNKVLYPRLLEAW